LVAEEAAANGEPVQDIDVADVDGDYDLDIVARDAFQALWFENLLCLADFDGGGGVNTRDFLAFLNAWNAQGARADINADGTINTLDVIAFVDLWATCCG
jgi:hypothetical protein